MGARGEEVVEEEKTEEANEADEYEQHGDPFPLHLLRTRRAGWLSPFARIYMAN